MPNAVALVPEYSPKHLRSTLVSVMFSGYMTGGIVAALISIVFIPAFGWRSIFLLGLLPLLLIPVLIRYLPESLAFYLSKGKSNEAAATLRKVDPDLRFSATPDFEADEEPGQGNDGHRRIDETGGSVMPRRRGGGAAGVPALPSLAPEETGPRGRPR